MKLRIADWLTTVLACSFPVLSSLAGCADSECAPKTGEQCALEHIPKGCDFLEPRGEVRCVGSPDQCEQAATEEATIRRYDLILEETREDGERLFTNEELGRRQDCLVSWAESLGLVSQAFGNESALVDATAAEVDALLHTAALNHYATFCPDCEYCVEFDEAECEADAFCHSTYGLPLNEDRECAEDRAFVTCHGADGCDDGTSAALDEEGRCWSLSNICYEPTLEYGVKICGDLAWPDCDESGEPGDGGLTSE